MKKTYIDGVNDAVQHILHNYNFWNSNDNWLTRAGCVITDKMLLDATISFIKNSVIRHLELPPTYILDDNYEYSNKENMIKYEIDHTISLINTDEFKKIDTIQIDDKSLDILIYEGQRTTLIAVDQKTIVFCYQMCRIGANVKEKNIWANFNYKNIAFDIYTQYILKKLAYYTETISDASLSKNGQMFMGKVFKKLLNDPDHQLGVKDITKYNDEFVFMVKHEVDIEKCHKLIKENKKHYRYYIKRLNQKPWDGKPLSKA